MMPYCHDAVIPLHLQTPPYLPHPAALPVLFPAVPANLVCKHVRADVKRSEIRMTPYKLTPESRSERNRRPRRPSVFCDVLAYEHYD